MVEQIRALNNSSIGIWVGVNGTVRGSFASNNGSSDPFPPLSGGIRALGYSLVIDNISSGNHKVGIQVSVGSTLKGNIVSLNGFQHADGVGITVTCPANVIDNASTSNFSRRNLVLDEFFDVCNSYGNLAPTQF